MKTYRIRHIVNSNAIINNSIIIIRDNFIEEIRKYPSKENEYSYYYAIPGFIDMHTHGGDGFDIMDGTENAFSSIAKYHLKNGTTSFLGSTITAPIKIIENVLKTGRKYMQINKDKSFSGKESSLLGFHLEGPWISRKNLGAQNKLYVIEPDNYSINLINKYSDIIKMVTFSYHNKKAQMFLHVLLNNGIIPACGHDETIDSDILKGFKNGLNHITHIYSNTSSFQRKNRFKHLGTLEMALMTPGISVEVIADNRHITKYFWNFITHNKSFDDIIIVSDSIKAAGLPENSKKIYHLGELNIIIDQGVAWLPDKSVFAGSISSMYKMFKILVTKWKVNLQEAVKITSFNQAKKLNIYDKIGSIKQGKIADIILMDKDFTIKKILKAGIEVAL